MARFAALLFLTARGALGAGLIDHPIAANPPTYLDSQTWVATSGDISIRGAVPGDVVTDLQLAGLIGDPLYELNWKNATLWDTRVWVYSTQFALDAAALAGIAAGTSDTLLVFDGVKMPSAIAINGVAVGTTTNQFLRYEFSLAAAAAAGARLAATNALTVTFDPSVETTEGRFMACSGGWDWEKYSETTTTGWGASGPEPTRTFTKGIWKSVYTVTVPLAAITHLVPHVFYLGPFPTSPLTDASNGGFTVKVRVHLWAPRATTATVSVAGGWAGAANSSGPLAIPAGDSNVTLTLAAPAGSVQLWWPLGLGGQTLYPVNATVAAGGAAPAAAFAERHVGFRYVVYATGNDTNAEWVAANTGGDGNAEPQGLLVRANGAPLAIFGANFIPVDSLEGRYSAEAVTRLVASAADANMNILRVWGGGIYQSPAFYDACDALGVLVLHDIQYAQNGHSPKDGSPSHKAEIQHQMRRLSHHASLAVIDGCNECHVILNTSTGVYATFVMQTVVDEDQSRVAWPSCPSNGWVAGVDRLSAHPNGSPLGLLPNARPPPTALQAPPSCQLVEGSDIDGDGVAPWSTPGASAADCCAQCNSAPGCAGVVYEAAGTSNCWFKADGGVPSPRANRTACINNNHHKSNTIEVHGPYQHGSGWPSVNGGGTSDLNPFPPGYPLAVDPAVAMGPQWPNQFASEFGGSVWSSFESMAPTLAPAHWGIHGGGPPDVCGRGFETGCNGTNVAAQRNYPTDNYLSVYFGDGVDRTAVGEFAFKAQLFQSMVGQALNVAMKITTKRLSNCFGTMVWQLGEIWPTGGWGSLEYATAAFTPGQILGGRWKPLHYWYRKALFTRVFATCGAGGHCMVKNDAVGALAGAALTVSKVELATGAVTPVHSDASLSLPPGPGAAAFFTIDPAIDGAQFVLTARVTAASGEVLTDNLIPLLPPAAWSGLGRATVTAVADATPSGPNGEVGITLTSDKVAAFVTLTTMAQGRFSDNAFLLLPGTQRVTFIPWAAGQAPVLQETLRVEHMASYM